MLEQELKEFAERNKPKPKTKKPLYMYKDGEERIDLNTKSGTIKQWRAAGWKTELDKKKIEEKRWRRQSKSN